VFDHSLTSVLVFPLAGAFLLLGVPSNKLKPLKLIVLNFSSLPFTGYFP
jgi:hypothetical protein